MARNAKSGLEYFPMDIDFFQDIRIRKLIKRQGGKAITVYALLLCLIYKNGYYMQWDEELPFIGSEMSGYDEAYVSEVIKTCLSLGLFDKNLYDTEQVLTSKGIQVRYCTIQRLNKRMSRIEAYSLIEVPRESSACRSVSAEKSAKGKKAKSPKPAKRPAPKPPTPEDAPEPAPQPQPQPVPRPQPQAPAPAKPQDNNARWLAEFFADNNSENLNLLCKNFGLQRGDISTLRTLASEVIAEWQLSNTPHRDYSDWSRHLISTMRIKNREMKANPNKRTPSTPPSENDYGGGFGGKDI